MAKVKFWDGSQWVIAGEPNEANTVVDASYVHTDNNYTTTEKDKLAGIEEGAEVNDPIANNLTTTVTGSALDATQGKVINDSLVAHEADGTQHGKTARFVIGTSTAGWTSADCDYLCDGTHDQIEINNAITALPATGGEIVILDGTYNIGAKINVTKDNVSIRGNGNATILKRMYASLNYEGVITLTSRSGCKIANLRIEGNKSSYNQFYNRNIYLSSSSNNTIAGNICNDSNRGISLESSSNYNVVTDNVCNNNANAGISLTSSSNDNTIIGNTCNDNVYGITLSTSSNNNTMNGNTCNNNSTRGLDLNASSNNTITGNTCNNSSRGFYFNSSSNYNTVTGNTCNDNDYGIYFNSSSNHNTVTGNTCSNNTYGIYTTFSSNNIITGNTCIRGTGLTTDYTGSQYTIWVAGTDNNYNLISNNNCMGKAVTVDGGTGNTIIDNKWSNSSGRILESYSEKLVTVSASGGSINLSLGNVFVHTPSGNRTYSITNAVDGQAHSFTLIINMGSTVRTLTFPASVKWQGGEIPDLSTASKTYVLTFVTVNGGTTWLGMFGGEF